MNYIIEFIRKYLGDKVFWAIVFLVAGGTTVIYAKSYIDANVASPAFVEAMVSEKIDTAVASFKFESIELKISLLRQEQEGILDRMDDGLAKPRHRTRLREVEDQLKTLDSLKQDVVKKLQRIK